MKRISALAVAILSMLLPAAPAFALSYGTSTAITAGDATGTTGTCTAGSCVNLSLECSPNSTIFTGCGAKLGTVAFQLGGTAFTATVAFQASVDEGATWFSVYGYPVPFNGAATAVTSVSGTGNWTVSNEGYTNVRADCVTFTASSAFTIIAQSFEGRSVVAISGGNPLFTSIDTSSATVGGTAITAGAITGTAVTIKASASQLYSIDAQAGAAAGCLQIFCTSTAITMGTSVPTIQISLAANGHADFASNSGMTCAGGFEVGAATTCTGATGSTITANFSYKYRSFDSGEEQLALDWSGNGYVAMALDNPEACEPHEPFYIPRGLRWLLERHK